MAVQRARTVTAVVTAAILLGVAVTLSPAQPPPGGWRTFGKLFRRQPRRYGRVLVHLGVLLMVIGIIGSSFYQVEVTARMPLGTSRALGPYTLEYVNLEQVPAHSHQEVIATLRAYRNGRPVGVLSPEIDFYPNRPDPMTGVAIRTTLRDDLYIALAGWKEAGQVAILRVVLNPLVIWIWIGSGVLVAGTLVAVWPDPIRARRRQVASSHPVSVPSPVSASPAGHSLSSRRTDPPKPAGLWEVRPWRLRLAS